MAERSYFYSENIREQACRVIPGGVNSSFRNITPLLVIKRAEGARLTDVDGNEYLDYHAAFGPAILGHNHPEVRRGVIEALEMSLLPGVGVTELELELARKIRDRVPSAERVLLCNTGSEATYHAIRLARAVSGRKKLIKFNGCYHGFHDYVLCNKPAGGGEPGSIEPGSAGVLPDAVEHTLVCEFNDLEGVEDTLRAHRGEVAALIVEPIAHNMGCVLPQPGFLEGLRELATLNGAVLIFDEVITGFRHDLGGYQKLCGVTPDLTTFGKAMANGFPISVVCGKAVLMERFKTRTGGDTFFSGTYNGNAASCAAALATIEVLEREPVHQHLFRLGERMRQGIREIHARLGVRATVAGYGSVFLTYFTDGPVENYSHALANDVDRFLDYRRTLMRRGILKIPLNLARCHLSYSHTYADVDQTLEVIEDVLKEMMGASPRPLTA